MEPGKNRKPESLMSTEDTAFTNANSPPEGAQSQGVSLLNSIKNLRLETIQFYTNTFRK